MNDVVDLTGYRERDLTPHQRRVLRAIAAGADCQVCGDQGFQRLENGNLAGAPCWECGKVGPDTP